MADVKTRSSTGFCQLSKCLGGERECWQKAFSVCFRLNWCGDVHKSIL